ncbi:hypothetical protein GCM10023336_53270 [Streptomyces similanensis]|uniref:Uncharacterized protein n=1 Tax=Streptomyces similanensis TaxID=1274988 RepID=A0ABP9L2H2_9ACTN
MGSSKAAGTDNWRCVRARAGARRRAADGPETRRGPERSRSRARGGGRRAGHPALAAPARAEYHPPHTRTSWEDGRWGG